MEPSRCSQRDGIFERLQHHFEAIPVKPTHQILTFEDLTPAIELFHALASRGHYEQAHNVFVERLMNQLDRIGATTTCLRLLSQLFPSGWESEPQVTDARCLFQRVSNKFAAIGELAQAIDMHARHNKICNELTCRLIDVFFLQATGGLKAAIGELDAVFARVTHVAADKKRLNEIVKPLLRILMNYAEVAYECGDTSTSRSVDGLISKVLWERWNASDPVFDEQLQCDSIGEQRYRTIEQFGTGILRRQLVGQIICARSRRRREAKASALKPRLCLQRQG